MSTQPPISEIGEHVPVIAPRLRVEESPFIADPYLYTPASKEEDRVLYWPEDNSRLDFPANGSEEPFPGHGASTKDNESEKPRRLSILGNKLRRAVPSLAMKVGMGAMAATGMIAADAAVNPETAAADASGTITGPNVEVGVNAYCDVTKNALQLHLNSRRFVSSPVSGTIKYGDQTIAMGNLFPGMAQRLMIPTKTSKAPLTVNITAPGQVSQTFAPNCNVNPHVPIPKDDEGYVLATENGTVYPFGMADQLGGGVLGTTDVAYTASGHGYWTVAYDGVVSPHGDAISFNQQRPALRPGEQIMSISGTPSGKGYWLFSNLGGAFAYGDAKHFGDMRNIRLNGPVVGSVPTPTGRGYYMVASDGGIFTFGDARFEGSTGAMRIPNPAIAMELDKDGRGYWIVTQNGLVYPFQAGQFGSPAASNMRLNQPVVGMTSSPSGKGYWLFAGDGGVFSYGDARFSGSTGGNPPSSPVRSQAALPRKAA